MKRLVLPALLLALTTCAALDSLKGSIKPRINNPLHRIAGTESCEKMLGRQVPFEEERDVGGVLAMGLAQKTGGFAVAPLDADGGVARPDGSDLDQLNRAVAEVGLTVTGYSPRPALPWTFGVLDTDLVNAFSAPGGYVFVTRGLLKKVENESQLAGVLAHEVAHVTLKHALLVYNKTSAGACAANKGLTSSVGTVSFGANNGGRARGNSVGDQAQKLLMDKVFDPTIDFIVEKGFGRDDEVRADELATDLLVMAGYDPREYQALLASLPNERGIYPNHPPSAQRAAQVGERLRVEWAGFSWDQNPRVRLDARISALKKKTAAR